MEEAPTPEYFEKIDKVEKIDFLLTKEIISNKNRKFIVHFKALSFKEIEIKAVHEDIINNIYEKKFIVDDIKKNKYFIQFDDLKEICEELKQRISKDEISIIESTNTIILSIPLPSSKIKEIIFELIQNELNDKEKINMLLESIHQQKEEISNLKKEIKELKELKVVKELKDLKELKEGFSFLCSYCILNLDSLIITDISNNSLLKNFINPKTKISANLLYRLSKDGAEIKTYHSICDNKGPTLHLFLLKMGEIVGFFANESIDSTSGWKKDSKCFIFNLTKKIKCTKDKCINTLSFYCNNNCGPSANGLGCNDEEDLKFIYHTADKIDMAFNNSASNILPSEGNEKKYEVEEAEVFQILI